MNAVIVIVLRQLLYIRACSVKVLYNLSRIYPHIYRYCMRIYTHIALYTISEEEIDRYKYHSQRISEWQSLVAHQ